MVVPNQLVVLQYGTPLIEPVSNFKRYPNSANFLTATGNI